jgi:hypothetical protein
LKRPTISRSTSKDASLVRMSRSGLTARKLAKSLDALRVVDVVRIEDGDEVAAGGADRVFRKD